MTEQNGKQTDDYDTPWKEILEAYFPEFMHFFFPEAYVEIDWRRGYRFLDKELQQVVADAELGRRYADKLVEVWLKNGQTEWLLIHVEVQGKQEPEFEERMFVYNYRLFDRFRRTVVSLAVLADESPKWKPEKFGYGRWGCKVEMIFPSVKLLAYRENSDDLEHSKNPFAVVVMTHLRALDTRQDHARRMWWKMELCKSLYARGYSREDIIRLFRFIDWVMRLSPEMEKLFWNELQDYEEERKMPYVTSVEKIGMEKGIEKGIHLSVKRLLENGFSAEDAARLLEVNVTAVKQIEAEMKPSERE